MDFTTVVCIGILFCHLQYLAETAELKCFGRNTTVRCLDECHKPMTNTPSRSVALPFDDRLNFPINDGEKITSGWYRILPHDGSESKPAITWKTPASIYRCGTKYPLYIKAAQDPHPKNLYEPKKVSLCLYRDPLIPCSEPQDTFIMNCGKFYVYFLPDMSSFLNPSALCIGDRLPCKAGFVSNDGYEPCVEAAKRPNYSGQPIVKLEVDVAESELVFKCDVSNVINPNGLETHRKVSWNMVKIDDLYRRQWSVHETKDAVGNVTYYLRQSNWIEKFSLGVDITCSITSFYNETDRGDTVSSEAFYAGLKLSSEYQNIVIRHGKKKTVRITSSIPIICPKELECSPLTTDAQRVKLKISMMVYHQLQQICSNGKKGTDNLVTPTKCADSIACVCADDALKSQPQEVEMELQGVQPDVQFGDAQSTIALAVLEDSGHPLHKFWHHRLPDVKVVVLNNNYKMAGKQCSSNNDPHMRTFEGRPYELHEPGTYTLYKHEYLPIEVQVYYQPCTVNGHSYWPGVACNCGVAVRSWKSVFLYDMCGKYINKMKVFISRIGLLGCDTRSSFTVNKKLGGSYQVILPTGTRIDIAPSYQGFLGVSSVTVTPSYQDLGFNTIGGLCGVMTGSKSDDLKIKNSIKPITVNDRDGKQLNQAIEAFYRSWKLRNDDPKNLFKNPKSPQQDEKIYLHKQCQCSGSSGLSANCTETNPGTRCYATEAQLLKICSHSGDTRRKREAEKSQADFDIFSESFDMPEEEFDENTTALLTANWKNGWNETSAERFCKDYLFNNTPIECSELENVDTGFLINGCVQDIKMIGQTDYALTNLQSLIESCQTELLSNNNNTLMEAEESIDPELFGFVGSTSFNTSELNLTTTTQPTTTFKFTTQSNLFKERVALIQRVMEQLCPGACNMNGDCVKGQCNCFENFTGVDCANPINVVPSQLYLLNNGVCDLQARSCEATVVFGQDFSTDGNSTMTCQLEEFVYNTEDLDSPIKIKNYVSPATVQGPGQAICYLEPSKARKRRDTDLEHGDYIAYGYKVSLSNNGVDYSSSQDIIIYDSVCLVADRSTKKLTVKEPKDGGGCLISGRCLSDGDEHPEYYYMVCRPSEAQFNWTNILTTTVTTTTQQDATTDMMSNPTTSRGTATGSDSLTKFFVDEYGWAYILAGIAAVALVVGVTAYRIKKVRMENRTGKFPTEAVPNEQAYPNKVYDGRTDDQGVKEIE